MPFFAVCYGHMVRYEKAADEAEAGYFAFGVKFDNRMTVARLPKSPKYMSQKSKEAFLQPLVLKHFENTGNVLEGWVREIAAAHPECVGWVLRDLTHTGFAVDDPIEGPIFTRVMAHADVWQTETDARQAGRDRGYKLVTPVQVLLDPNRERATAVAYVK